MKRKSLIIGMLITLSFIVKLCPQQMYMASSADGPILFIDELGIVLKEKKKTVEIDFAAPSSKRKEEYRKIDLQKGDKILMANGKKITSMEDLKKLYENMKDGEQFKMGLSRNDQMFMVSFKKGDADKSGGGHTMTQKITVDPKNMAPVMELGFIAMMKKDKITVSNMLPAPPKFIADAKIKEGDEIIKVNGAAVNSIDQFKAKYEKVKAGENLELTFLQGGKEIKASGKKPEAKGKMIIKQK